MRYDNAKIGGSGQPKNSIVGGLGGEDGDDDDEDEDEDDDKDDTGARLLVVATKGGVAINARSRESVAAVLQVGEVESNASIPAVVAAR